MSPQENITPAWIRELIEQVLREAGITRFSQFASMCIPLYEYVLTIDDEVTYFWGKKFGWGSVIFLLNRYYILVTSIFNIWVITAHITEPKDSSICVHYFRWFGWAGLITTIITAVVLIMRVYALYNLSKRILVALVALEFTALIISAWLLETALSTLSGPNLLIPTPKEYLCNPESLGPHVKLIWAPTCIFDAFLCGLVMRQALQVHGISAKDVLTRPRSRMRLIEILMRDSVMYFIVSFIAYVVSFIFLALAPPYLIGVPLGYSMVLSSCMCSRMVINIREKQYKSTQFPVITTTGRGCVS